MITKRIDMREASKSRATRLAEYVTSELSRAGRVADVFTVNCLSDEPLIAAKEMEICQARNTRAKNDKTYHLLLSFPDGERPDADRLQEIATEAAKALGYAEHQRIAVVHDDTDNLHMHLIINKIHPQRHTIHTPRHDFKILGELCTKLEQTLSLRSTNHEPTKSRSENKAHDLEKQSGTAAFLHYAREKVTTALSKAKSWDAVHQVLAEFGLAIQAKGNGLVIVDQNSKGAVKASSLGREFSKAKLEKRLGEFVTAGLGKAAEIPFLKSEHPRETYAPRPLNGASDLYQKYLVAKHSTTQTKAVELAALWEKQKELMRKAAEASKLVLPVAAGRFIKRTLRKQARDAAKAKTLTLRQNMANARIEIRARYKARGFINWLKQEAEQGNAPAICALRRRGAVAPALVNITTRDLRNVKLIAAKIAHVTGRGTLFYRVGQDVFRDNGSHVSLKRDVSDAGILAALRIAMSKFSGNPLTVNGIGEFKKRCIDIAVRTNLPITFSDIQMEKERQEHIRSKTMRDDNAITSGNNQKPPQREVEQKRRGMSK